MFNGSYVGSGKQDRGKGAAMPIPPQTARNPAFRDEASENRKSSRMGSRFHKGLVKKAKKNRFIGSGKSTQVISSVGDNQPSELAPLEPILGGEFSIQSRAPERDENIIRSVEPGLSRELELLRVGAIPLLTRDEEVQLAARIKTGDEAAREQMIRANLRLVVKIARDYEHLGLPLVDLVSEGIIGLMKAVDRFDPAKGGKLSTYGSWWIKQQIRRALANQSRTIRLPVHVEAKLYRLGQTESRLRNLLGREVTDEELANELKTAPKRIARLREASIRPSSLDAPAGEDGSSNAAELVGDDRAATPYAQLEKKVDYHLLGELVRELPAREAHILRLRFGLDGGTELTLEEVGKKFGLTRERIRQIQNETFGKLREMMEDPQEALAAP